MSKITELSKELYKKMPQQHSCNSNCSHNHELEKLGITKEELAKVNNELTQQYKDEFGYDPMNQPKKKYERDEMIHNIVKNYKFWEKHIPQKDEKDYTGEDKVKALMCKTGINSLINKAKELGMEKDVAVLINKLL